MTSLPFDEKQYLQSVRFAGGRPVEDILLDRIRLWKSNAGNDIPVDRIFPLYGMPGVGKTWLLQFMVKKHKGILLDFNEKYATYVAMIKAFKDRIEAGYAYQPGRIKLLLMDHVPALSNAAYLEEIEQHILIPALKQQRSFLVIAQQDPNAWCWSAEIPHTAPYVLRGFAAAQKESLFKKIGLHSYPSAKEVPFGKQEIFPMLAGLCRDSSGNPKQTCEGFLRHWLEQIEPGVELDLHHDLKIAGALTWVDNLLDSKKIEGILKILGEDISLTRLRVQLGSRKWIMSYGEWNQPVRTILHTWFQTAEPSLSLTLNERYGDQK